MTDLTPVLTDLLTSSNAEANLRAYFAEPTESGEGVSYSGRNFERLGGGGDQSTVANRVTAEDLLAVEMLSVSVPPEVIYQILHGQLGERLGSLLTKVPTDVWLGHPDAGEHLANGAPAGAAWSLLTEQNGVGWVTAGKLLARKRPLLIPVYDDVVRCALGQPAKWWLSLHETLIDHPELAAAIERARCTAQVPAYVGDLRVLDIIVWMEHHQAHRDGRCAPTTVL